MSAHQNRGRRAIVTFGGALAAVALMTGCSRKPNVTEHFDKGNEYFAQGRFQEATIEYRVALSADPKRGDIHEKLADALAREKDLAGALREYVVAADLRPNDAAAQIDAGNYLLIAGAFEDARGRADKALAIDPKNPDALILKGNALAGLKDFDSALNEFQQALVMSPTDELAHRNLAALQANRGKTAEAEASYRKAVEVAPKSVQAHLALAGFYWGAGRLADAEQAFKDTAAAAPNDPDANRGIGMFLLATGRTADAEPYFRVLAKQSKSSQGTLALADYYVAMHRLDDATKVLSELSARDASAAAAADTRQAAIAMIRGDRAGAMTKARAIVDAHPKELLARLLIARLQLLDGKPADALTTAAAIITEDPTSPVATSAYQIEGEIQAAQGNTAQARRSFQEVIKRKPDAFDAMIGLASIEMAEGTTDQASAAAQQAAQVRPNDPRARALLIRAKMRRNETVASDIAALRKDYPQSPTVYNLAAIDELRQRHPDAARAAYAKALALAPSDVEALSGVIHLDLATGHQKDAVDRIEGTLKTQPPSARILLLAASVYSSVRDKDKTEASLQRAIQLDPGLYESYQLLGGLYLGENRLDDAREQFETAAKVPHAIAANTMLGMIFEMQHRPADAEKAYSKAIEGGEGASVAANNLAWLYVSGNRNLDQALQLAQSAVRADPREPHFQDTLAWIYYKKNMAQQAIEHGEASVKGLPKDPGGHYHLGMAYLLDNQLDPAKAQLQQALSLSQAFDGADEAKKALERLGG